MTARFEIAQASDGKFQFLLRVDGSVLLSSLACDSKIMVQNEILHVRNSMRDETRVVAKLADDGTHFVVIKDRDGSMLARSPHVGSPAELATMTNAIRDSVPNAHLVDLAKHKPLGTAH